jgi:hypothetical protein
MNRSRRSLGVLLLSAAAIVGCGPAADETTDFAAGGATIPLSPSEIQLLSESVAALRMPSEASAAVDHILAVESSRYLSRCAADGGFKEREVITSRVVGSIWADVHVPEWYVAPDASSGSIGFGVNTATPDRAYLEFSDPEDPNDGTLSEKERASYDEYMARCIGLWEEPRLVDWNWVWGIQDGAHEISVRTQSLPEFQPILQTYQSCMSQLDVGGIADPAQLLEQVKALSGDKSSEEEIRLAKADFDCRSDLVPKFLNLAADDWRAWLDRHTKDFEAARTVWSELIRDSGIAA